VIKPALAASLLLVSVIALAGCSGAPSDDGDGRIQVVASTNVYGDLAQAIGGDAVEVTSIIDDPSQDPHQFEANGRVQLALSRADVVIVNGGGYDDFATQMLDASGNGDAILLNAVELSGIDENAEGFNEHVWYDYNTMQIVTDAIARALTEVDPGGAEGYSAGYHRLDDGLMALIARADGLTSVAEGKGVVITEPVPLYLLAWTGLVNLTPPEFSEAIEEDSDVPPVLLQQVLNLLGDGSAALVVYNEQTGGPQTDAILDVASENGVPAIGVTETLPTGEDYLTWQGGYLDQLATALTD
jgi:zinc/manganese transport system substrate-binding protein